jgi:hypothetical protein
VPRRATVRNTHESETRIDKELTGNEKQEGNKKMVTRRHGHGYYDGTTRSASKAKVQGPVKYGPNDDGQKGFVVLDKQASARA